MIRAFLLILALAAVGAQLGATARKIVGKWRYDVKSIRIEFAPEVKKKLATAKPSEKKRTEAAIADLKKFMGRLRLEFLPDHQFLLRVEGDKEVKRGKWSLSGKSITVTMHDGMMTQPQMTLSNDNKTIRAASTFPGFGTGYANLTKQYPPP